MQQAVQFHHGRRLQKAEKLYRDILKIQPNQPGANHNLGLLAMQTGNPALGLPYLQKAWKINPHGEQFCLTLAECLLRLDHSSEALQIIENAMQREGLKSAHARRMLQLATSIVEGKRPSFSIEQEISNLLKMGHFALLEERLSLLLNQYPNWGEGWDTLCTTLQIQGKDGEGALQRALQLIPDNADAHKHRKIFCIGANKTGTTSMEFVFRSLGLAVGNQGQAEMLRHDWARQDYRRIIRYCQSAEAFQDAPFSYEGTFRWMDEAFPRSKFILTVRNNADEWFESLVRFHSWLVGKGRIPTADDLRQFNYCYRGFLWDSFKLRFGDDESRLYNREMYMQRYEEHNKEIKEYFKDRPDDLLVLNIAEPDAMQRLLVFLGYPYTGQKMPHLNASKN